MNTTGWTDGQRLKAALDAIQEAQNLLDTACAALSSASDVDAACRAIGQSRDHVHQTWYAVENARVRKQKAGSVQQVAY